MKATIVIPTYWRGAAAEADTRIDEADYRFAGATPVDEEGTLAQVLEGIGGLDHDDEFMVVVVAVPTRRELSQAVQLKVESITARFDYGIPLLMVGPVHVARWRRRLLEAGREDYEEFLHLDGYADARNLALLMAVLTDADVAVLLEDDVLVRDADHLRRALEFVGGRYGGSFVSGVTGCLRGNDDLEPQSRRRWRSLWGGNGHACADGDEDGQPRLRPATFAFGGNMVIHRTMFEKVPFDPRVPGREASDYLINGRFLGFEFFADRELWVRRLTGGDRAPLWYGLRQDIVGFNIDRAKLRHPAGEGSLAAEDLDPYPGRFLRDDLHDLVLQTCLEVATEYLADGREREAEECMSNIAISKAEAAGRVDAFSEYLSFQRRWQEFVAAAPALDAWRLDALED